MVPIGMLLQGGLAAGQLIGGLSQKNKRPNMQVSGATNALVNDARNDANASQRAGRNIADQNIRQNAANAISNVQRNTNDVNKILAVASAVQGSQNQAMRQQDALDIQAREQAKIRLQTALSQKAAEQQRVWDYNTGGKYLNNEMQKQSLLGAGTRNLMSLGRDASVFSFMKENKMLGADNGIGFFNLDANQPNHRYQVNRSFS